MWIVGMAWALAPEAFEERLRSVSLVELDPELYRRIEEPLELQIGGSKLTLRQGVMVPVFSGRFGGAWETDARALLRKLRQQDAGATLPGEADRGDRELVGFVWLRGEGSLDLSFPTRGDALRWANHQVLAAGADRAALAPVASFSAPFRTRVDQGVFLSADPVIDALFLGDAHADPFEIVVYPDPDDLSGAQGLLDERVALWDEAGVDWPARVGLDRVAGELGHAGEPALLADLRTETRTAYVSVLPTPQDRWMAMVRDDRAFLDARWASQVAAFGRGPEGVPLLTRITGEPFPPRDPNDPTSPRVPPAGVERVSARAELFVQERPDGQDLSVEHRTRVTLRATAPTAFVDLTLPRTESVPGTFEVVAVEVDGAQAVARAQLRRKDNEVTRTVTKTGVDGEERSYEEVDASKVRVVFPEVVPAGGTVTLNLRWLDTWPYANWLACGVERPSGSGSGIQDFLPEIAGTQAGGPWVYVASVAVPDGAPFKAVISGVEGAPEVRDGWRIVTTEKTREARFPNVAIGRWKSLHSPAAQGFPQVDAHLFTAYPGQIEQMAPEARRVISYYQGWLPEFPVRQIDIVESPAACGGFVWVAPHGMASLQRMWVASDTVAGGVKSNAPKLEHAVYAHELAHQYFGQVAQPASLDDRWMTESFAEAYACMYVAATFGKAKLCEAQLAEKRRIWEGGEVVDARFPAALRTAFGSPRKNDLVYAYGPVVLLDMLRPRVGTEAFFAGLDVLLRDHPADGVTEDRLRTYLQNASGKDLTDFFDYWVASGHLPAVSASWAVDGGVVQVEVRADVPFGTFDVPVRVSEGGREQTVWVEVIDGSGRARSSDGWSRPRVDLDPDGRILARSRRISRQ